MLPWAGFLAFTGDLKLAIGIFVLWCIMSIVRQFIEPKIVSGSIGIHPIFTLIAMYTGFKFIGVWGLLLGPIILIILKNIYGTVIDKGVVKSILERWENLSKTIDFINKMQYNEYTNIDKLIYQIN